MKYVVFIQTCVEIDVPKNTSDEEINEIAIEQFKQEISNGDMAINYDNIVDRWEMEDN